LEVSVASRDSSIKIAETTNASISNNLFVDSLGPSSIEVGSGGFEIDVANNIFVTGKGEGIHIGKGTSHIHVADNVVADQDKEGISVDRANCVYLRGNIIFKNHMNGIRISRSKNVAMTGNRLIQNGAAGVFVRLQEKATVTIALENQFIENATGFRGQAASQIVIADNDLSAQLPIMVSGDFAGSIKAFLSAGTVRTVLDAASWATHEDDSQSPSESQPLLPCQNGS
jgi:parallel beta-helix repeat protein